MEKIKEISKKILKIKIISSIIPLIVIVLILKEFFDSSFWEALFWVIVVYLAWSILKFIINEIIFHLFIKNRLKEYYFSLFKEFKFPEPEEYIVKEPEQYLELVVGEIDPKITISIVLATTIQNYRGENFNIPALMRIFSTLRKALIKYRVYKNLNIKETDEKNTN